MVESKKFDISKIDFDRLRKEFEKVANKNLLLKNLQQLVEERLARMLKNIIAKQNSLEEMISYTIVVIVLFVIVYSAMLIFREISYLPQKHRIAQMECIANDLQAILDIKA